MRASINGNVLHSGQMPEIIQDRLPLVPLVYALLGYFGLQVILSVTIRVWLKRARAQPIATVTSAFWAGLICFLICFFLCGWFGNSLGMRWVDRLMREAGIWERAGNFNRSELIFKKAGAIFDSFLISPLVRT